MDALERPSARINATRPTACLPLVAVHSPCTPLICNTPSSFHGRCPTHITQTSPPAHTHASLNTHAHTTRTQHHTHAQHTHTPSLVLCHERPSTPRLDGMSVPIHLFCNMLRTQHPLMYLTTRTRPPHTAHCTHTSPESYHPTTRCRQG
jgi:hypothetical protein